MEKPSQSRQEMDAALKERFVPSLRQLGFKGSYPHFRRISGGRVELVGVQFSQWGRDFYVELAIADANGVSVAGRHIEAGQLKHYHGWPRIRLGDVPFDFSEEPADVVAQRAGQLAPQIDAWFSLNVA